MSRTFGDLVEEILSNVRGFTSATDQVTSLSAAMTATDTTGKVDNLSILSSGIIECGDELMWVSTMDASSGTFQLLPKGRGWNGTTAASHALGDTVTVSPAYPRSRIKNAINTVIQSMYPTLYAVATTEFTQTDLVHYAWQIPAEAERILDVRYRDTVGNWQRVRAWEVERSSNLTDFPSGVSLIIRQHIPSASAIRVIYGTRPAPLVNETDLFTITGFDDSTADIVILGVLANIIPMLDVARLQVTHVSAEELNQARPLGSAVSIARDFRQQYTARLQQELTALNMLYPARVHLTR